VTPEDRIGFERELRTFMDTENHEATQPPVYYLVAGAWHRLGGWIGLREGQALYWVRFLNVLLCCSLTWLSYAFTRAFFPDRAFVRVGVPFLIAFFPQDAFYLVNNDVLLPLIGGAAFFCLLLIHRGPPRSIAFHAGTGLLVAATILVKFSSVAILPVAAAVVGFAVLRPRPSGNGRAAFAKGAVLMAAAAVPIAAWCARNVIVLGDVTGSADKARSLGWTLKPLGAFFSHPIFTLAGVTTFWSKTLATFWRGEIVWGLQPLASPGWDRFYAVSSVLLIASAVIAPRAWNRGRPARERDIVWPSLALFLLSLTFLAGISVSYDFGDCFYPSREMPYITSGRLALGALIPFAALYVSGLDALLPARVGAPVRWLALIVPVVLMTLSEIHLSKVAFSSPYNWFHMF
jgi:hypothetical protein